MSAPTVTGTPDEILARIRHQEEYVRRCRAVLVLASERRAEAKSALDNAATHLCTMVRGDEDEVELPCPEGAEEPE